MPSDDDKILNELVNNSVILQKATIDLVDSVKRLNERLDKLLSLFEETSKNIQASDLSEPITKQLQIVVEQNKTIAQGLVILEKYIREKSSPSYQGSSEFTPSSLSQERLRKLL